MRTLTTRTPEEKQARLYSLASPFLERALLFTFIAHLLAMVSMSLLLPGLPGGPATSLVQRANYVASHPWLWRLGWFPWQLTALSDLILSISLLKTSWIPRRSSVLTVILTMAGFFPDQIGQAGWITNGVRLAQEAFATADNGRYATFESSTFLHIAGFGTIGYLLGALGWTWCFAAAGTWSRQLSWLSLALWSCFGFTTLSLFLPATARPAPFLVSAGNAIAFVLLMIWFVLVAERVWSRVRPVSNWGRYAAWRHFRAGTSSRVLNAAANSHFLRAFGERMPVLSLASEMTDVIYLNYLVEARHLLPLVPPGLKLQTLGPDNAQAVFTILVYRHGHLGPKALDAVRKLFPSPFQSNWRIYVTTPDQQHGGVYFLSTCISSTPHALGGRIIQEGLPMHRPQTLHMHRAADGSIQVQINPGSGSSPDLNATLHPVTARSLPEYWRVAFAGYDDMLAYVVPQNQALSVQPWYHQLTRQEIALTIPLESCESLTGNVTSTTIQTLLGDCQPVCFRVPKVDFHFLKEIRQSLRVAPN
jgi:hypothetical protein